MPQNPENYKNQFSTDLNAVAILRAEKSKIFGQEANFSAAMSDAKLRGIADAFLADGDIVDGGQIDIVGTNASLDFAKIYIRGSVRDVPAHELTIPLVGTLEIGVVIEKRHISALEDPDTLLFNLPGHPANGASLNPYVQEKPVWGLSTEVYIDTDEVTYSFYPKFKIVDGVVLDATPPPELSGFFAALAQYDRRSNGHYVVNGFRISLLDTDGDNYELSIEEGVAHVHGIAIERSNAQRIPYINEPLLSDIANEPHTFSDGGSGTLEIELHRRPIAQVDIITVIKEKTVQVIHGNFAGAVDSLNEPTVSQIISVVQAGTTFDVGTDFIVSGGDNIDWSPTGGQEPAPGSTYDVTYQYYDDIEPDATGDTSVTISGALTDSQVTFHYKWKLPRIDLITLSSEGEIQRLKGASHPTNPRAPAAPSSQLRLAEVYHDWLNDPEITDVSIGAVSMEDRQTTRELARGAFREVAAVKLQLQAQMTSTSAKSDIFVDNFDDNQQRDAGRSQQLIIIDGLLTLPVSTSVSDVLAGEGDAWTNAFVFSPIIEQLLETGETKINPYAATEPLMASVSLTPAVDQWAETHQVWSSTISRRIADWVNRVNERPRVLGSNWRFIESRSTSERTTSEIERSTETSDATFLRQRNVVYLIRGFEPFEVLNNLSFDGIALDLDEPKPSADANGVVEGNFDIPANVPTGSKSVEFVGDQGSVAVGSYVGNGTITIQNMRRVITTQRVITVSGRLTRRNDPAGFYFSHPTGYRLGKIEVKLRAIGDSSRPIILQIRELVGSQPWGAPLAEVEVDLSDSSVGDIITFELPVPLWVAAFQEIAAIFMTDDASHAVAIAKLGKRDVSSGAPVIKQPNTNMVAVTSSNNDHFNFHHDWDFHTRVFEAQPTENLRTVELGDLPVVGITDLLPQAGVEEPADGTRVDIEIERANGTKLLTRPDTPISFTEPVTETLKVRAHLIGNGQNAPVLFQAIQMVLGTVQNSGDYVSRAFTCGDNRTVEITTAEFTPGTSGFTPYLRDDSETYHEVALVETSNLGNGWVQRTYRIENFTSITTAVKFTAIGSPEFRPVMEWYTATPLKV